MAPTRLHTRQNSLAPSWHQVRAQRLPADPEPADHRHLRRPAGRPQTFPSGVLRPADLVTCKILGHKLEDGVPIEYVTSSTGYGGKNVTSVTLSVTHNRDGSVTASCHVGDA